MGLKVIGAGFPRTGTLSLKFALQRLGFGRCYHMTEFILHPEHAALWAGALDGEPDWTSLFAGYQSTTDFPSCFFWRELADQFPDAKVVLSIRPIESWFESLSETVGQARHRAALTASPIGTVLERMRAHVGISQNRDRMIEAHERHVASVKAALAPDRLLVFEACQGWHPLCAFLGVPTPDAPFPHLHARDEARAMVGDETRVSTYEEVRNHYRALYEEMA
jgi:hypothetical protein